MKRPLQIIRTILALAALCVGGCGGVQDRDSGAEDQSAVHSDSFSLTVLPESFIAGGSGSLELTVLPDRHGSAEEAVLIELRTQDAEGLKACYATLHFDPQRWRPAGVEWTDALAGGGRQLAMAVLPDSPGGRAGEIALGSVLANYDRLPGLSGSAVLCRLRFVPAGTASAALFAPTSRQVSLAPDSTGAQAALAYDAGTQTLSWLYAFPGDYDQNGEANIADLTPLGLHFGAGGGPFPAGSIEAQVDGDGNGEINIGDITPLGANFGRRLSAYNVYRSAVQAEYPATRNGPDLLSSLDSLLLSDSSGDPSSARRSFSLVLSSALGAGENVWVRPLDESETGVGALGSPSQSYPDDWTAGEPLPINTPPVAHNVQVNILRDTSGEIVMVGTDADGDDLNYTITSEPAHGWFGDFGNEGHLPTTPYIPDPGYTGPDSFTYTVTDGIATSNTATVSINVTEPSSQLPAFPGAEGFGAFATGGRGGQVIFVTNLNTSGPGSLQEALDTPGPKYILFRVSGVINGQVTMNRGDVTVAGQTSPGGIIVRGWIADPEPYVEDDDTGLVSNPQNFIIRHIRSRPDFDNATMGGSPGDDGLRLHHAVNGIVDHCSIANAADEAVQISWSRDITIQDCMLAETLGDHAYLGGMLVNYSNPADGWPLTRLSIHHNCWNRIMGRMPELSRESPNAAGSIMELELSNNLLWDPGISIQVASGRGQLDDQPVYYALNWVGNRAIGRASFPEPTAQAAGWTFGLMSPDFLELSPDNNSTYFSDNVNDSFPAYTDYQQLYCCNDYDQQVVSDPGGLPFPDNADPGPFARSSRHAFPPITYTASADLPDYMVQRVGAFPRDPMDRRLLSRISNMTIDTARRDIKHPADDTFALDFEPGNPPPGLPDSDDDGMPDSWENLHGLNTSVQDHNGTQLSLAETGYEGYTNLEVYLIELSDLLLAGGGV